MRLWFLNVGAVMVLALALCPAHAARKAGDIEMQKGTVKAADGSAVPYEIGTIYLPENRANPKSRLIGVGFARIKARQPGNAPPVFWLPGGPGLAVLDAFDGTSEAARSRLRSWLTYGAVGDLVVVEQRGNTFRGEMLQHPGQAMPLDRPVSAGQRRQAAIQFARDAVAANSGKDLAGYTIKDCADDVDAVRRALGYGKITLFGGSFGSQWSFAVMRSHPGIVARAVLAAVEPLDFGYDMPSQLLDAMKRIAADADRDPALAPYLPPGGVMAAAHAVRERLAKAPAEVTVDSQRIVLGLEDFQSALQDEASDAGSWPAFVLSLYHGHYEGWARKEIAERQAQPQKLIGPLIDTSLGVTPQRAAQLRSDPALHLIGSAGFEPYMAAAETWPTPDMGDSFRRMAHSDIPVLLIHGDWDSSTPVDNTLAQLPYFPNGKAIIVHRGGHDGAFYLLREAPQVKEAVYRFLKTGEMKDLPGEVTLPVPAFVKPAFAPGA
ncbi:alpha/beta hydrolase [Massilia endophytica]|uniref:alpha/beta hydrolase n=1 Tax=Massilia endophytica TaxID=2899220 RepID=UPI001E57BBE4|nr:alpha/beta fold hydrolase [Massilia endophytica]UGQ48838.1 alpha/beta hydrolase [Massilia endophytica]